MALEVTLVSEEEYDELLVEAILIGEVLKRDGIYQ